LLVLQSQGVRCETVESVQLGLGYRIS